jgi:hypothetical protein
MSGPSFVVHAVQPERLPGSSQPLAFGLVLASETATSGGSASGSRIGCWPQGTPMM